MDVISRGVNVVGHCYRHDVLFYNYIVEYDVAVNQQLLKNVKMYILYEYNYIDIEKRGVVVGEIMF